MYFNASGLSDSAGQNWLNLDQHHQDSSQLPNDVPGYTFTQHLPPTNWDPLRYGQWEGPLRVLLVPNLPSANRSQTGYNVVVLYRDSNLGSQLLGPGNWMRYPGDSGYLRFVCCGPSTDRGCKIGSRTVGPCAHGTAVLRIGCVLPNNQVGEIQKLYFTLYCLF